MESARRPVRAYLETLRAPLLLSPVADVLAGATVALAIATGNTGPHASAAFIDLPNRLWGRLPTVGLAALAGCCLLAAGMAFNAYSDREDDRRRKPDRPLPRGDISPAAVRNTWLLFSMAGLAAAAAISSRALDVAMGIVVLTWLYHVALKRWRLPGCLALGTLRSSVVVLGMLSIEALASPGQGWSAWRGAFDPGLAFAVASAPALLLPILYGLYIMGASLHATTDDEPAATRAVVWSRTGLGLCLAILLLLAALCLTGTEWQFRFGGGPIPQSGYVGGFLFLYCAWRLYVAIADKPPPAITGVALSGLYLFQAGIAIHFGRSAAAAALILVLFGVSRLLLRSFPPS